jgi:hypothetical protein
MSRIRRLSQVISEEGRRSLASQQASRIRDTAFGIVDEANLNASTSRKITKKAAFTVVLRSLQSTRELPFSLREHMAIKELSQYITLAQSDKSNSLTLSNTDLLPVSHPRSTRNHAMTASALMEARARWVADDPRIVDGYAKTIIASALTSKYASVEHVYYNSILSSLPQGVVPAEVIVAASNPFSGGNSSAERSLRARLQRRDREGKFAFMGGGLSALVRKSNGRVYNLVGRPIIDGPNGDDIQMELPDGKIVNIPASKGMFVKAVINPTPDGYSKDTAKTATTNNIINEEDLSYVDAPQGWKKTGPNTWISEDGWSIEKGRDKNGFFQYEIKDPSGKTAGTSSGNWEDALDSIAEKKEGKKAVLPSDNKNNIVPKKAPVDIGGNGEGPKPPKPFEFKYPEGAVKIKIDETYEPEGRNEEESSDYTDDPIEIGQKFDPRDLVQALEQGAIPQNKGENATGYGVLRFNGGDEFVPVQAIYNALDEAGEDAALELARIYDKALGGNDNENALKDNRKGIARLDQSKPDVAESFERTIAMNPDEVPATELPKFSEAEMNESSLPPVLEGLSDAEKTQLMETGDHTPYLPENESIDMPEGYNTLDPAPFSSWREVTADTPDAVLPEGFSDNPVFIAKSVGRDKLETELRRSIEPDSATPGYANISLEDEDGEEFVANVPGEAVRDALQLQGVDTNALIKSIADEGFAGQKDEPIASVPTFPVRENYLPGALPDMSGRKRDPEKAVDMGGLGIKVGDRVLHRGKYKTVKRVDGEGLYRMVFFEEEFPGENNYLVVGIKQHSVKRPLENDGPETVDVNGDKVIKLVYEVGTHEFNGVQMKKVFGKWVMVNGLNGRKFGKYDTLEDAVKAIKESEGKNSTPASPEIIMDPPKDAPEQGNKFVKNENNGYMEYDLGNRYVVAYGKDEDGNWFAEMNRFSRDGGVESENSFPAENEADARAMAEGLIDRYNDAEEWEASDGSGPSASDDPGTVPAGEFSGSITQQIIKLQASKDPNAKIEGTLENGIKYTIYKKDGETNWRGESGIIPDIVTVDLSGQTFEAREAIKREMFRWDANDKVWRRTHLGLGPKEYSDPLAIQATLEKLNGGKKLDGKEAILPSAAEMRQDMERNKWTPEILAKRNGVSVEEINEILDGNNLEESSTPSSDNETVEEVTPDAVPAPLTSKEKEQQVLDMIQEEDDLADKYELEGMTRSDAQSVAMADMNRKYGRTADEALAELPRAGMLRVLQESEKRINEERNAPAENTEPVGQEGVVFAIDVNSPTLQEDIQSAIDKGQKIAFSYNGKERIVLPKGIFTNPKNGNVNLRAIEDGTDGGLKVFTLDKMEMAEGALPSPNAPLVKPEVDDEALLDRRLAGESLDVVAEDLGISREEVRRREMDTFRERRKANSDLPPAPPIEENVQAPKKELPQNEKVKFSQLNEEEQMEILRDNARVEKMADNMAGIKAGDVKVGDFVYHRQLNRWEKVVRIEQGKEKGLDRVIFYVYNPIVGEEQPRPYQRISPLEFVRRIDGGGMGERFPVGKARGRGRRKDIRVKEDPLERVKIREGRVAPAIDKEQGRGLFRGRDGEPILKGDVVIHADPEKAKKLGRGIVKRRVGDQVDEGKKVGGLGRDGKARLDYVKVQWENEDAENAINNDGDRLIVAKNLLPYDGDISGLVEKLEEKPWKGGVARPNGRNGKAAPAPANPAAPAEPNVRPGMPEQIFNNKFQDKIGQRFELNLIKINDVYEGAVIDRNVAEDPEDARVQIVVKDKDEKVALEALRDARDVIKGAANGQEAMSDIPNLDGTFLGNGNTESAPAPAPEPELGKELVDARSPGVDDLTKANLLAELKKMRLALPKARADVGANMDDAYLKKAGRNLDKYIRSINAGSEEDNSYLKIGNLDIRGAIFYLRVSDTPIGRELSEKLEKIAEDVRLAKDGMEIARERQRKIKIEDSFPAELIVDKDNITNENLNAMLKEIDARLPGNPNNWRVNDAKKALGKVIKDLDNGIDHMSLSVTRLNEIFVGLGASSDASDIELAAKLKPVFKVIVKKQREKQVQNRQANLDKPDPIALANERVLAGENVVDAPNVKDIFAKDDVFAASPFLEPFKEELQGFFAPAQGQPLAKLSAPARQALNQYLSGSLRDVSALKGATPEQTDKNIREAADFILALRKEELAYSPNRDNVNVAQALKDMDPEKIFKYGNEEATREFVSLIIDGVDTGFLIKLNERGVNAGNGNNFWLIDTNSGQKLIIKRETVKGRSDAEVWSAKLLNAFGVRGVSHVERHPKNKDILFVAFAGDNLNLETAPNVYEKVKDDLGLDAKKTAERAKVADLIGMMIFDGVASNTDRHDENFLAAETPENGVARNGNEDLQLLPIDHGYAHRLSRNAGSIYDSETLIGSAGYFLSRAIYRELVKSIGGRATHHLVDLTVQQAVQELKRDNGGIDATVLKQVIDQLEILRGITPSKWAKVMGARE